MVEENEIFINCCLNDNYEVSNKGRLRNKKTNDFLDGYTPANGYLRFKIKANGNFKYYTASRVIYQSFNINENIDNLDIDHIDRDKANNKLNNLRPTTRQQNTGNQKVRHNNKLNLKNIHKTEKNGNIRFIVEIRKEPYKICKTFNELEDAIIYRDQKINEIWGIYGCNI